MLADHAKLSQTSLDSYLDKSTRNYQGHRIDWEVERKENIQEESMANQFHNTSKKIVWSISKKKLHLYIFLSLQYKVILGEGGLC